MVNRLQSWVFISLAMAVMGLALFPIVRVVIGIDKTFSMQFFTVIMLLIAGLMLGLTGMLLLARRQPEINNYLGDKEDAKLATQFHACGLLLLSGIPLMNFIACYFLWVKHRHKSAFLDYQGREAICFQISIYLYLLLSLFMAFAVIGIFFVPILVLFHALVSVIAVCMVSQGKAFRYPANITIIARTPLTQLTSK